MKLVRADSPVPVDHHVVRSVWLPAIKVTQLVETIERIPVTSLSDDRPRYQRGLTRVLYLNDAEEKAVLSGGMATIWAALDGGGDFKWIEPNAVYWVETRAEYEAELEREAEDAARELSYLW